jgi:hypothetical protein
MRKDLVQFLLHPFFIYLINKYEVIEKISYSLKKISQLSYFNDFLMELSLWDKRMFSVVLLGIDYIKHYANLNIFQRI